MKLPNGYGSVTKLSGKRRKPYIVQKTIKWVIDSDTGKLRQEKATIGYARTRAEGLKMLAEYNADPYDVEKSKKTFAQIYESWSTQKYDTISESNAKAYSASFACCSAIHDRIFKELRVNDLQGVIDTCGKNYPTLRKLKVLFRQMYSYAMRLDICGKDYSEFVDIARYKDKNPNARARDRISEEDINKLWTASENEEAQIALMLIYTGVRVSELLDLKKSNINLDEQWFDVVKSKTENGIRKVPIADKLMPFFKSWYKRDCEYLICTHDNEHFTYRNYYDSYWKPVIAQLGIDSKTTPHFTRHTCVSMLADAGVTPTIIKKIVGHSGAMSVTESVYTHLDIKVLVDAVNKITP